MAEYDSLKGSQQLKKVKNSFDLEQDNNYYLKASKNNYAPTRVRYQQWTVLVMIQFKQIFI